MASHTFISITCPKCNYRFSAGRRDYVQDVIGCPVIKCSRCNTLSRHKTIKEWIQMTDKEKRRAIAPRAGTSAFFTAFLSLILFVILGNATGIMSIPMLGVFFLTPGIGVWSSFLYVKSGANSKEFVERYGESIRRTNVPEYRKLLESMGPIYGEGLPGKLKFDDTSLWFIKRKTDNPYTVADIEKFFLTFEQTIKNVE